MKARIRKCATLVTSLPILALAIIAVVVLGSFTHTLLGALLTLMFLLALMVIAALRLCWHVYGETPKAVLVRIRNDE